MIVADATLALIERWRAELSVLRRRSPTSDAVKTLADCVEELVDAVTAGHDMTVQLTISEAHEVSRIPVSTLRWLCNHKAELVGARKQEGVWYLDRTTFERYLASPEGHQVTTASPVVNAIPLPVSDTIPRAQAEVRADLRLEAL